MQACREAGVSRIVHTSTLEDGLSLTIDWMRQHLDRYRPGVYAI